MLEARMRSVAINELNSAVSLLGRWDPVRLDLDESSLRPEDKQRIKIDNCYFARQSYFE